MMLTLATGPSSGHVVYIINAEMINVANATTNSVSALLSHHNSRASPANPAPMAIIPLSDAANDNVASNHLVDNSR
jgi:hypothetical protein